MSENPVRRKFSRHIDIRKYSVHELVFIGFLKLVPLRRYKMVPDALTKRVPSPAFVGRAPSDRDWSSSFLRSPTTLRERLIFASAAFLNNFFPASLCFIMSTHQ